MNAIDMAKSYLIAKFGGVALPDIALSRLAICMECPARVNKDGYNYCNSCGCPKTKFWPDSELRNKVKMAKAACPKKKWLE